MSKDYRTLKKKILVEAFGSKCCVCGYSKLIKALEFHHMNEKEKKFSISQNHNIKWEDLVEEVDKCILVCCLCHREIHANLIDVTDIKNEKDLEKIKEYFKPMRKKQSTCACCGKKTYNPRFCSIECNSKSQEIIQWDDKTIIDLYINKKINVLQLSILYKVSYNTMKKRLKKLKIFIAH